MTRRLLSVLLIVLVLASLSNLMVSAAKPGSDLEQGGSIYLKEGTIDTNALPKAMPKVAGTLSAKKLGGNETGLFVIQFNGPILEQDKQTVTGYGVKLGDYIPDFAFLAQTTPAIANNIISRLKFVKTVIRYEPSMKISSKFKGTDGSINLPQDVQVRVITFDSTSTQKVNSLLSAKGIVANQGHGFLTTRVNQQHLADLALDENVTYIEAVKEHQLFNDKAAGVMNASAAWNASLTGSGQIIGICDTGLDNGKNDSTMLADFRNRIVSLYALGRTNNSSDTHGHGTHVAGSVLGNGANSSGLYKGLAYESSLVFQSVLDSGGGLGGIPADLNTIFTQAYNDGARIHSNSWGVPYASGGNVYDAEASQVDSYTWNHKDMLVLFAAGNDGDYNNNGTVDYGTVTTPGSAKNCLTVGASENNRADKGTYADNINSIALFSSRGWCAPDSRIKPDLVSPGTWILSTKSSLAPDSSFWGTFNQYYAYMGGTSMATPLTAGAAALVRQYYMTKRGVTPQGSLTKATLINGAVDMGLGYTSRDQGWGRLNLGNSTSTALQYDNESTSLATNGTKTYTYNVTGSTQPFKVTLVWTDYPASTTATKVIVNDLDLTVTAPGGTVYYGNDFTSPFNSAYDRLNNVENVFINTPASGTYTVVVKGYNVPQGPQPFALVASGVFGASPTPTVTPLVSPTKTPTPSVVVTPTATKTPTPSGGSQQLIVNGGFESGTTPWIESSTGGYEMIDTTRPHAGSYSAYLVGYNSGTDIIYQTISIPANATTVTLSYYLYMSTTETTHPYDYLYVQVRNTSGTVLATLQTFSDGSTAGSWSQFSNALASYKGQTVQIAFKAVTDSTLTTSFFVDDVSVISQ